VSEKKFETKAIRHQMTRTNQKEHSVPIYATSSYQFDDAEDARALFAGEKKAIFIPGIPTRTMTSSLKSFVYSKG